MVDENSNCDDLVLPSTIEHVRPFECQHVFDQYCEEDNM